jgi:hypothetical protein
MVKSPRSTILPKFGSKVLLKKLMDPEPEPKEKTMTVLKLTGRLVLTEAGIEVCNNVDWIEQRTAMTGQEIVRVLAMKRF